MVHARSQLLPPPGKDKYHRRNVAICLVILFFVVVTTAFAAIVFSLGLHIRSQEDIDEERLANRTESPALKRNNLLLVIADDLRPYLGCYGDPVAVTPNIDQLANSGHLFTNAFAQEAICAPSRTSMLTSRRPDSLHLYANDKSYGYWRTTVGNFSTLPQYFKENGYYTASIGKIFHDGVVSNRSDDYPYSWTQMPFHPPTKKHKMDKVCPDADGKLHMNMICPVDVKAQPGQTLPDIESTEFAKSFLTNYAEGSDKPPFFLGVGFYKPHIPLKYPKEYLDFYNINEITLAPNPRLPSTLPSVAWNPWTDVRMREDMAKLNMSFPYGPMPNQTQLFVKQSYYASITYIDDLLGQLLGTLEETGLAKDTTVIFLGDHGWSLGEHQEWSKYSNYEIALNVPLIINTPERRTRPFRRINERTDVLTRRSPSPVVIEQMVELVDLFPTLVDMFRLPSLSPCPNETVVDLCTEGLSFEPLLRNKTMPWKASVFSQYPRPSLTPQNNSDQPKLSDVNIMGYSMRTSRYRYTEWLPFDHNRFQANWSQILARELYDHETDWLENHNLAFNLTARHREIVEDLSAKLEEGWRNENGNARK